jgi:hypothetical protein
LNINAVSRTGWRRNVCLPYRREGDVADKVMLNCEIKKETDDFLKALKMRAADEQGIARLSYGWAVDEIVRRLKQLGVSTKSLQSLAVTGKVQ